MRLNNNGWPRLGELLLFYGLLACLCVNFYAIFIFLALLKFRTDLSLVRQ